MTFTSCKRKQFLLDIKFGLTEDQVKEEAIKLATIKAGLTNIDSVELTTAGPIYRLILGKDGSGQDKAVWLNQGIVFSVNLKDGVPRSQMQELLRQRNLDHSYQIQLIYVPDSVKNTVHTYLKKSASNIFWLLGPSDVGENHRIFVDFYDGSIVYEF